MFRSLPSFNDQSKDKVITNLELRRNILRNVHAKTQTQGVETAWGEVVAHQRTESRTKTPWRSRKLRVFIYFDQYPYRAEIVS